jgi:hypothetical protein
MNVPDGLPCPTPDYEGLADEVIKERATTTAE